MGVVYLDGREFGNQLGYRGDPRVKDRLGNMSTCKPKGIVCDMGILLIVSRMYVLIHFMCVY